MTLLLLMVQKSGKLTQLRLVVEISLFTRFGIHPNGGCFEISEPSTAYHKHFICATSKASTKEIGSFLKKNVSYIRDNKKTHHEKGPLEKPPKIPRCFKPDPGSFHNVHVSPVAHPKERGKLLTLKKIENQFLGRLWFSTPSKWSNSLELK